MRSRFLRSSSPHFCASAQVSTAPSLLSSGESQTGSMLKLGK